MHDQASRSPHTRHLAAVPPNTGPPSLTPADRPVPYTLTLKAELALRPTRVTLTLWHRQTAEDARQLLYRLAETSAAELAPSQLAFTLGMLHGSATNLLDIIDAITEP